MSRGRVQPCDMWSTKEAAWRVSLLPSSELQRERKRECKQTSGNAELWDWQLTKQRKLMNHAMKESRISIHLTSRSLYWRKWMLGHRWERAAAALEFLFLVHMCVFASPCCAWQALCWDILSVWIMGCLSSPLCPWSSALTTKTLAAVTRRETTALQQNTGTSWIPWIPRGINGGTYVKDILCQVGKKNNTWILHFGLVWGSVVVLIAVLLWREVWEQGRGGLAGEWPLILSRHFAKCFV